MSTLRTSISLASSTLFPAPVNFTKTVEETVNGYHNGFQQVTIANGGSTILYSLNGSAGTSGFTANLGIVYFYAESLASNSTIIRISIGDNDGGDQVSVALLTPGSFLYLPVSATDTAGTKITAFNQEGDPAVISFFIGESGPTQYPIL